MRRNSNSGRVDRRQFIGGVAAGAAALATTGTAVAGCKDHDEPDLEEIADGKSDETYCLLQKKWFLHKKFLKITPLKGSVPIEELYGYDLTHYSSTGTTPLQREDTCTMFLYEGPDGDVSLVIVNEKLMGDNDGGSASFEFLGLPEDGEWLVQDDGYGGTTQYDQWETDGKIQNVHWTWKGGRNDGGAYGPLDDDLYFRIDPSFNEDAELYGEEYDGEVDEWEVLSGRLDDPERHTLWMDEGVNFFRSLFSGRDHDDYWDKKREEWKDDDGKDHDEDEDHGNDDKDHGKDHDKGKDDDDHGNDDKDHGKDHDKDHDKGKDDDDHGNDDKDHGKDHDKDKDDDEHGNDDKDHGKDKDEDEDEDDGHGWWDDDEDDDEDDGHGWWDDDDEDDDDGWWD